MAYLSKEAYERKQAYADRRMRENREIETLTEEQHDVLSWLCSIRHKIHSMNTEHLFCSQSSDYDNWRYIDTFYYDNEIMTELNSVNLPKWEWNFDSSSVTTDADEDINIDEVWNDAIYEISGIIERWNESIEDYLRKIDEQYGTSYCPTGRSRIF